MIIENWTIWWLANVLHRVTGLERMNATDSCGYTAQSLVWVDICASEWNVYFGLYRMDYNSI